MTYIYSNIFKCREGLFDQIGLFSGYCSCVLAIPSSLPFFNSLVVSSGMTPVILGVDTNSFNPSRLITSSLPLGSEKSLSQSVSAFSNGFGEDHDLIWARRCEEKFPRS